ncbi:hypothetical protein BS50DRAFT_582862 [Corynespora cassiicola Philippines]|uniref:Uncharacterized protein n=1 Tax=Corynespora cassiicola Philippines TaxID=1448308 RepID=A0A2T2P6V8_CORCC|nr:hypothetical protein BS50DRAFT_582862 [Corynespora cassiicola Philippines]
MHPLASIAWLLLSLLAMSSPIYDNITPEVNTTAQVSTITDVDTDPQMAVQQWRTCGDIWLNDPIPGISQSRTAHIRDTITCRHVDEGRSGSDRKTANSVDVFHYCNCNFYMQVNPTFSIGQAPDRRQK